MKWAPGGGEGPAFARRLTLPGERTTLRAPSSRGREEEKTMTEKRACRECEGTRKVVVSGVHPRRGGDVTTMEAPDEWEESCPCCQEAEPETAPEGAREDR